MDASLLCLLCHQQAEITASGLPKKDWQPAAQFSSQCPSSLFFPPNQGCNLKALCRSIWVGQELNLKSTAYSLEALSLLFVYSVQLVGLAV